MLDGSQLIHHFASQSLRPPMRRHSRNDKCRRPSEVAPFSALQRLFLTRCHRATFALNQVCSPPGPHSYKDDLACLSSHNVQHHISLSKIKTASTLTVLLVASHLAAYPPAYAFRASLPSFLFRPLHAKNSYHLVVSIPTDVLLSWQEVVSSDFRAPFEEIR